MNQYNLRGNMKYYLLSALCSLLLASCVSISDVVPAGKDTWMVGGSNTRIGADDTMKADLYKTATAFCAKQNKMLVPISSNHINIVIGRPGNAELIFRCLLESDPEYQRPNMKPVPNTSIEVIQK